MDRSFVDTKCLRVCVRYQTRDGPPGNTYEAAMTVTIILVNTECRVTWYGTHVALWLAALQAYTPRTNQRQGVTPVSERDVERSATVNTCINDFV
jgi:hypothetical protein